MTWPLTGWISFSTPPVRSGSYLVLVVGGWADRGCVLEHGYWNGKRWMCDDGATWAGVTHWCGLAFDPASVTEYSDSPRGWWECGWWVPKP